MRSASVFHLAQRPTKAHEVAPQIGEPPPARGLPGWMTPAGCGPWQEKAKAMQPGQYLTLDREPANTFRRACKGLGFTVTQRSRPDGRFDVYLVSKGLPCPSRPPSATS